MQQREKEKAALRRQERQVAKTRKELQRQQSEQAGEAGIKGVRMESTGLRMLTCTSACFVGQFSYSNICVQGYFTIHYLWYGEIYMVMCSYLLMLVPCVFCVLHKVVHSGTK